MTSCVEICILNRQPVPEHQPEKEGKTINGSADVKSDLRMITVEDEHFSMWKEFIERHHRGELINPNLGEMFKEKKSFTLSSKF